MLNRWLMLLVILVLVMIFGLVANRSGRRDESAPTEPPNQEESPTNRVVALLELTGDGWTHLDRTNAQLLERARDDLNLPIELVDTRSEIDRTKRLLVEYYNRGVRKFIGGSRSTVLEALAPLIHERPDLVFNSTGSTARVLAEEDNIYRLVMSDPFALHYMTHRLIQAGYDHIHIFQETPDVWTQDMREGMIELLARYAPEVGVTVTELPKGQPIDRLRRETADLPVNTAFLDIMVTMTGRFFEAIEGIGTIVNRKHYGFDGSVFFPFEGVAAAVARRSQFEPITFQTEYTPRALEILDQLGLNLRSVHPFALATYDVAQAYALMNRSDLTMSEAVGQINPISGNFTLDRNGDRANGRYVFYLYNDNWDQGRGLAPTRERAARTEQQPWSPVYTYNDILGLGTSYGPIYQPEQPAEEPDDIANLLEVGS